MYVRDARHLSVVDKAKPATVLFFAFWWSSSNLDVPRKSDFFSLQLSLTRKEKKKIQMGCKFSEPQIISEHQELLGCCWEADHSHGDVSAFSTGGAWYPYDPKDPGKRHCHAFRVQRGVLSAERNDYLNKHNLGVSAGVGCVDRRNVNTVSISDSTIKQCTTSGVGFRAHGSLNYVSLGGEFARAKEAGPGSSMSLTVIVVQCHEVSIDPSQHQHYRYERSPVNTNSVMPNARRLYGEGVVSNVLYGGYLVIETSQENYEAMQRGFAVRGALEVGAGGGGVDVGFANSKIEGAKSTNFNVRCYGGKNVTCNFTNCPIEKILKMVDDWANDLLRNRYKALPIAIRLAAYSGIEHYVLQLGSDWEDGASGDRNGNKINITAVKDEEERVYRRIQQRKEDEARIAQQQHEQQQAMQPAPSDPDVRSPFGRAETDTFMSESNYDALPADDDRRKARAREELAPVDAAEPPSPSSANPAVGVDDAENVGTSQEAHHDEQVKTPPLEEEISEDTIDKNLAIEEFRAACRELDEAKASNVQLETKLAAGKARLENLFRIFFPCAPRAQEKMLHYLTASVASTRDVKVQVEHLRTAAALLTHPKCSLRVLELSAEAAVAITDEQAGILAGYIAHRHCSSLADLYVVNHHIGEKGAAALISASVDQLLWRRGGGGGSRQGGSSGAPVAPSFSLYLEANSLPAQGQPSTSQEFDEALAHAKTVDGFRLYV